MSPTQKLKLWCRDQRASAPARIAVDEWIETEAGRFVNYAFPNLTLLESDTGWQMLDDGEVVAEQGFISRPAARRSSPPDTNDPRALAVYLRGGRPLGYAGENGRGADIPSGNPATDQIKPGSHMVYDRGELLWLIAQACLRMDSCLEELAREANLTTNEIAAVRAMID